MSEAVLKKNVKKLLDALKPRVWYYCAQDRFTSGIPDIIGVAGGKFFAMELKRDKGKPTLLQTVMLGLIMKAGGRCGIVRNLADAIAVLDGTYEC